MRWLVLISVLVLGCAEERDRADANVTGRIHPPGILEPTSDNFHGRELARRDYDFALCAKCHGDDFNGGAAKVSCLECHADGPTACATCHREEKEAGAHAVHRTNGLTCVECHTVPERWDAEGHIRTGGKADPAPAEVVFGARAGLTIEPADRAGPPQLVDGTCKNVYCHGDALGNAGGLAPEPRWTETVVGGCDRCHGAPPPSHAQDRCASCHPQGAAHIDGAIEVGRTTGCDGCHGRGGDPAPPFDLDGNEFTTALGVGAHQAHLTGSSLLRAPLACTECHAVPATLDAAGHIDSPLPAEVVSTVGWNRITGTCANAWCHGSAAPVWTQQGGASCGTCHGVPPATGAHSGISSIQACTSCHPSVIDASGAFIFTNGVTEHLDGDVDVF